MVVVESFVRRHSDTFVGSYTLFLRTSRRTFARTILRCVVRSLMYAVAYESECSYADASVFVLFRQFWVISTIELNYFVPVLEKWILAKFNLGVCVCDFA